MSWLKLSINTTHESVDWVKTLLSTTAYTGDIHVVPYNKTGSAYQNATSCEWAFTIHLYLPDDASANSQLDKISNRLSGLQRVGEASSLDISEVAAKTDDTNAINSSIHRVGQHFVIVAPETTYQAETVDEISLKLPESLAFGSGLHPATMLSLQLLEQYTLPSMEALDLGSGSGILSIAMAKLGATVLALDNDSVAVRSTQDAVNLNQVAEQVTVMEGSLGVGSDLGHWMGGKTNDEISMIQPTGRFDIVVANLLARIHIALAGDFQQALRRTDDHSGLLITAGFTTDYEDAINSAFKQVEFEAVDRKQIDEWVALVHQRKA